MKKTLLLSGILLALCTSVALAGGFNAVWDDFYGRTANTCVKWACWEDWFASGAASAKPAGVPTVNYPTPCDDPTETVGLVVSAVPNQTYTLDFVAGQSILDGQTVAPIDNIPAPNTNSWWQAWNTGSCRQHAIKETGVFTSGVTGTAYRKGCSDPYGGSPSGGISAYQTALYPPPFPLNAPAPNAFRIKVLFYIASGRTVTSTTAWYMAALNVNFDDVDNPGTEGPAQCPGCLQPACIVLNEVALYGMTSPIQTLINPINNQFLSWNGGSGLCQGTPSKNATWGQVKSLYR